MRIKIIIMLSILLLVSISGCATYQEVGYQPTDNSHQYSGRYSKNQYDSDIRRSTVTSARQQEYDRHQNSIQRRSLITNSQVRDNVIGAAAIVGGGLLLREYYVKGK